MAKRRKTREGKIIAQLRRELKEFKKELKRLEGKEEKPLKLRQIKKSQTPPLQPFTSSLYLTRDLTKSLILSILALAIEFVVYWFTNRLPN